MRTVQFDYEVAAPPDRVFAALTDLQRLREWRTLDSVRLEPEGPARVGSRIHTTVKGPGQTMRFVNEVTELDPVRRRYDDHWLEGTFVIESGWEVVPNGAGSRIRWTTRYAPRGVFRLFGPLPRPDHPAGTAEGPGDLRCAARRPLTQVAPQGSHPRRTARQLPIRCMTAPGRDGIASSVCHMCEF